MVSDSAGFPVSHDDAETGSPNDAFDQSGQEITMGNSGHAIVIGDMIDIESDGDDNDDDDEDSEIQMYTEKRSGGACPNWIRTSSSKVKVVLGLAITLLLAFVAVMAVGLTQLSSGDGGSSDGGVSSAQVGVNTAAEPSDTPVPTKQPSPGTETTSPTLEIISFPIINAEVQIALPNALEKLVPNFLDGMDSAEKENYKSIELVLEKTLYSSLAEKLPTDYSLESVQIQNFKDEVGNNIHPVIYSTSVTVSCVISDCTTAPQEVLRVVNDLSEMDYIQALFETHSPTIEPTARPTANATIPGTNAATTDGDATLEPPAIVTSTGEPAPAQTSSPSLNPTVEVKEPTTSPTVKPTVLTTLKPTEPLRLEIASCTSSNPCTLCKGKCTDDSECAEGLSCFRRAYLEYIPGCLGPGSQGQSYCYDPFAEGSDSAVMLSTEDDKCDNKRRCDKCSGDCDTDDDCSKGLYCFRRTGYDLVPGCAGQGVVGRDYCFDANDIPGENDYRRKLFVRQ